jgi:hypothetical protein
MHRREALRFLGAAALAPLAAGLSAEERWQLGTSLHRRITDEPQAGSVLTGSQMAEVRALAETILPRTDSPGAADVGAPAFLDRLLAEWYTDTERSQLLAGLDAFTARCRASFGGAFAEIGADARASFLATIDGQRSEPPSAEAAYARVKDVMVFAFLTSAPIAPLVQSMPVIPGRFDGCVPV